MAIGDYVHLRLKNYNKYGINYYGEGAYEAYDYEIQKNKIKQKMQQRHSIMTEAEKTKLKNVMSEVFAPETESDSKLVQMIRAATLQILVEDFQETLGKYDWSTGNITVDAQKITKSKDATLNNLRIRNEQKTMYLNTLQNRISAMRKAIETLSTDADGKPVDKSKLNADVDKAETLINDFFNNSDKAIQELIGTKGKDMIFSVQDEKGKALVQKVNETIRAIRGTIPISKQKGEFFELPTALMKYMMEDEVKQQVEEMTQKEINDMTRRMAAELRTGAAGNVGMQTQRITIDTTKYSKHFDPADAGLKYDDADGNTITVNASAQRKVDVAFELKGNRKEYMSLKNINPYSGWGISLVSEAQLLNLIQDEDPNFVNHYLNLIAHNKAKPVGNAIDKAKEAMKLTLLYKAISGDTASMTSTDGTQQYHPADVLVINDNTKSGKDSVYIYSISELLNYICDKLDIYSTVTIGNSPIETYNVNNTYEKEGYPKRISKLIAQLYKDKVSASLKADILAVKDLTS